MTSYRIKFRRHIIWRTFVIVGHKYDDALDRLNLNFADGSIREIANWSKCEAHFGPDLALKKKSDMEQKVGQSVPVRLEPSK